MALTNAASFAANSAALIKTDGPKPSGKYSVHAVAAWFLRKEAMTPLKLQELCYYAQAWNYTLNDFPLIDSDFQAWSEGPISPSLFKKYKLTPHKIPQTVTPSEIRPEDEEILERVWKTYGDQSGTALEVLTQRELPWQQARIGLDGNEPCTAVISPSSMKTFYSAIYTG